jgi:hypothetical protein
MQVGKQNEGRPTDERERRREEEREGRREEVRRKEWSEEGADITFNNLPLALQVPVLHSLASIARCR